MPTGSRPDEDDDEHDEELDELVFAFLERVDGGAAPDTTLAELAESHPGRAADLRASVDALRAAGLLQTGAESVEDFPEEIGGYRLGRRLGAGGMGVVFLAEGPGGERVALKLIRPEQLYFDRAKARFQRELEAAGRLEHPGIASVIASGEEGGLPFLAQSWVPGASLDALLAQLRAHTPETLSGADLRQALESCLPPEAGAPDFEGADEDGAPFAGSWEEVVLRLVLQVAKALEHAHRREVLHRDVKPSNVMLTARGRAVLVDFGLATAPDSERLTRTGAQPGSLPYMAPEQLEGSPSDLDARTDVYALGVTLYELLTLRPPYQSQSAERVRRMILEAHPAAPRRLNGLVSASAELVCIKAMDRDPRRRYGSAGAMAADIERLLSGRPVHARAPGAWLRVARWARRRPVAAAGLVLVVVGPLGWAILAQWAMARVQSSYREEQEAHARAERHFELTLGAMRGFFAELADGSLEETPHMQRTRLEALERALEVVGRLERERPGDALVRAERGHLLRLRGDVLGELGRIEDARASYGEQVELFEGLLRQASARGAPAREHLAYELELSLALERRAALLAGYGDPAAALEPYAEALALLRRVAAEARPESRARAQLVVTLQVYTNLLSDAGRLQEALAAVEEGSSLAQVLLDEGRGEAKNLQNAAMLRAARARVNERLGRIGGEVGEREAVVTLLEEARALEPDDRRIAEDLALEAGNLALAHSRATQHERALEASERGVEGLRALARGFPSVERYRQLLLERLQNHAVILSQAGRGAEGSALLAEQADIAEALFLSHRGRIDTAELAAMVLNNLAVNQIHVEGEMERALATVGRAQRALGEALALQEHKPSLRELRGVLAYNGALATIALDRRDRALEALEAFAAASPEGIQGAVMGADLWAEWVQCLARTQPAAPELEAQGRAHCLDLLEEAHAGGFRDPGLLNEGSLFGQILRDEPRWRALLADSGQKGGM